MIYKTLLSFLFFICLQQSIAQSKSKDKLIAISKFLQEIETDYNCSFSYLDKDLDEIYVIPNREIVSLEEVLSYLENNTPLKFIRLDQNDFAISLKTETFKICGKIISDSSELPIPEASIIINDKILYADNEGNFELVIASWNDQLKIQALGYQELNIPVKKFFTPPCRMIYLYDKIESLKPVIINNFITKGIDKNYDNSIQINYSNFAIIPGQLEPDLLQTLQAIPGVMSVNEKISDLNIRGGTQDQNLILWDGIKMYQTSHFFGLISAFNPYLTKNVTLYKNGSNSFYGDGVSSVIAMQTEDTKQDSTIVSLGINLLSIDGYADTSITPSSSLQITARKSLSEFIETPTYQNYFDKSFQDTEIINSENSLSNTGEELNFYDVSLRYLHEISENDILKINFLNIRNNLVFNENALVDNAQENRESSLKQQSLAGGVYYKRKWNKNTSSGIHVYGSNYILESTNADIINNQQLFQQNEVLESGLRVHFKSQLNKKLDVSYGYQFNETGISHLRDLNNPTFRDYTKEVIRTNSLYASLEFKSKDSLTYISTGLRFNKHNKFNTYYIEPRFSLNQKIATHLNFQINGEIKSQTTSQIIDFQNDFLGVENRKWVLSNEENIPVLISNQIATGFSYTPTNWLINTEVFYKKVDGILTKGQGFQNQFENISDHGEYNIIGVEVLVNRRLKNINLWFSYAYNENNYRFDNLSPTVFPNNLDIRHTATIALSYFNKKIKYSAGINWNSGKPSTGINLENPVSSDNTINYRSPNTENLADYLRLDASILYYFNLSKKVGATAGLSIWNITGKNNTVNTYYSLHNNNEDTSQIYEINESGLNLTTNAVFRINF